MSLKTKQEWGFSRARIVAVIVAISYAGTM